jgi:hypothetical protein
VRVTIPRIATVGLVLAGLVLVVPVAVHAQSFQGLGYGIGGIAGYSGFFGSRAGSAAHVAGGGELLVDGRAGAAGEFGFLLGPDALSITSVNGVFHAVPVRRDEPFSPFVTAGYTHMSSGEGAFDAWNIGVGADLWTSSHRAFRLEFRDHVRPDVRGTVHYWSLRAGIAFR